MASLKDIKTQIGSVKATQQITSAMQMVATVKLQKAEKIVSNLLPYQEKIDELLHNFLQSERRSKSLFEEERELKRTAIVAFSANMSLCGAFNANVTKKLTDTIEQLKHQSENEVLIYTVGKKTDHAIRKKDITPVEYHEGIAHNPNYEEVAELAERLMTLFQNKEIDKVILIYHQFKSKGVQILTTETLLPISFENVAQEDTETAINSVDYIIEPDKETLLNKLVPKVIKLQLYRALLESYTSEQAARNMAMQSATDNADDMLDDLSLLYNKSRQQSITNELLDIIGATFK